MRSKTGILGWGTFFIECLQIRWICGAGMKKKVFRVQFQPVFRVVRPYVVGVRTKPKIVLDVSWNETFAVSVVRAFVFCAGVRMRESFNFRQRTSCCSERSVS